MNNEHLEPILEQVCQQVASLSKGELLREALRQDQDYITLLESREIGEIKAIRSVIGRGPQNLLGEPISTNFHDYLEQVINPQIARGEISDGGRPGEYDDRKSRWSGTGVTGNWYVENQVLFLEIGPTTYPRYSQDLHRDKIDSLKLILKGLNNYQDPYAYFTKAIGVTVVPISQEGHIHIGERSTQVDTPNLLNFVAGLATFNPNLEKINFYADIEQELKEEIGISLTINPDNTKFIGIAGNPFTSENDLVFVTQTPYNDGHFESCPLAEHSRLVPLCNKQEVSRLLNQGILPQENKSTAIAYGSRMALEYLVNYYF